MKAFKQGGKTVNMPRTRKIDLGGVDFAEIVNELHRMGYMTPLTREQWSAMNGQIAVQNTELAFLRSELEAPVLLNQRYTVIGELLGIKQILEDLQRREELTVDDRLVIGAFHKEAGEWIARFKLQDWEKPSNPIIKGGK